MYISTVQHLLSISRLLSLLQLPIVLCRFTFTSVSPCVARLRVSGQEFRKGLHHWKNRLGNGFGKTWMLFSYSLMDMNQICHCLYHWSCNEYTAVIIHLYLHHCKCYSLIALLKPQHQNGRGNMKRKKNYPGHGLFRMIWKSEYIYSNVERSRPASHISAL